MKRRLLLAVLFLFLVGTVVPFATANSPEAKVISAGNKVVTGKADKFDTFAAPYVEMARRSLPEAIERFQKGLPDGCKLYVTFKKYDDNKNYEQIVVLVTGIDNDKVSGTIFVMTSNIPGYKFGDVIEVNMEEICDWTIKSPDGTREGNYVGKMFDVMVERKIAIIVEMKINEKGQVVEAKFVKAVTPSQLDVSFCVPDSAIQEACKMVLKIEYKAEGKVKTSYTYAVYDFFDKKIEKIR